MGDVGVFNTTGSKLWTRVQLLFKTELEQQYAIMRQKQFTVDNMMKYIVDEQISAIPMKYYNFDSQIKYLNYGSSYLYALHGSGYHHIRKWLRERLVYCDTLFGYNVSTSDYITLRANKLGEVYLDIQTYIPMYVRIKFRDEANSSGTQIKRVGRGETVRFSYSIPSATDQEIIVYAGHYLKSLGDVSNLQPSTMLIANADRLTEITCHSPNLINTDLSECTMLQRIDLSNSTALGTGIGAQPILNIQNCKYLRYCNCLNTQLTAIYTMQQGGNLEELYFPETTQVIQVTNQTYLHTLGIPYPRDGSDNYCKNLATVQITNCNAIKYIQYPYVENEGLKFESLKYVQNLSITNSIPILTSMSFRGFNKLKNITLSTLPNLVTLGFDNMLGASDVSTFKTMTLSNMPKVTRLTFNVDNANYKIAFAGAGKIDMGGLQSALTIESNYSIKGLDTIILPTSIKELRFSTTYGDGINELKNLWSATSNHASDGFTGIDFQDMSVSFIDMLGLSQVSNAINFNIAPVDQHPNMNTNRDGTDTKPYFKPTGTINLNNYTGSMANMLKGVDLSLLTVILDVEKSQTDLTSLFQGATIVEADKTKINNILSKFPSSTIWDYMFAYVDIPNLEGINIGTNKMSLKGWAKGSSVTKDILIPSNIIAVDEIFMNCVSITSIRENWNNTYTYTITAINCYVGCILVDLDEVPVAWGGLEFSKDVTGIYVVEIPTDNYTLYLNKHINQLTCDKGSGLVINGYSGIANWGDGSMSINDSSGVLSHTYKSAGIYTIKAKCVVGGTRIIYDYNEYYAAVDSVKATLIEVMQLPLVAKKPYLCQCGKLKKVTAYNLIPYNTTNMFNGCSNLESITGLETWDMSNVTNMANMFKDCNSLTQIIGLETWDTRKCTDMSYMFYNCNNLTDSTIISKLNYSSAINISNMFYGCPMEGVLDLTGCNFSSVTNMSEFLRKTKFNEINIPDTPKLINATSCFYGIKNLTKINKLPYSPNNLYNVDASLIETAINTIGYIDFTNLQNTWATVMGLTTLQNVTIKPNSIPYLRSDISLGIQEITNSPNLTVNSLLQILNGLTNLTATQQTCAITLTSTNLAKLTDQQKAIATNKGWTLS